MKYIFLLSVAVFMLAQRFVDQDIRKDITELKSRTETRETYLANKCLALERDIQLIMHQFSPEQLRIMKMQSDMLKQR